MHTHGWRLILICTIQLVTFAVEYPTIDFTPFHQGIQQAIKSYDFTILSSYPKECFMPKSSIMFTYSNYYTMPFIYLQQQSMEVWNLTSCFQKRFITVCLDKKSYHMCLKYNISHCVYLDLPDMSPSQFNQGDYIIFTYIKQDLIIEALKYANEIFFIDADVLLFHNPWPSIYLKDDENQTLLADNSIMYDIRYQRERGGNGNCGNPDRGHVNSGVMYLRNTTKVNEFYIPFMRKNRDIIIAAKDGYEQDFVSDTITKYQLYHCVFHASLYTSKCIFAFDGEVKYDAFLGRIVTYHTSCVGKHAEKLHYLKKILRAMQLH